jgi:hypothetical protein
LASRRVFLKSAALSGAGLALGIRSNAQSSSAGQPVPSELFSLSESLLRTWCSALLKLQITDQSSAERFGGIICPAKNIIHGRIGDTIYPFLYLAHQTTDSRYLDAALMLYEWMDKNVSQPDGSWLNEPAKGSWKGTTVFSIIALAEALKNHGAIMPSAFKTRLTSRLKFAGEYVYREFTMDYGNINYPVTASYALSLLGEILDEKKFTVRGREFAHEALKFITKTNGFIYGEGDHSVGPYGSYAVDLGYNVEESLPSLAMYGLLRKDEEILHAVTRSMKTHLEFMLPDGGWDNSWGTRSFKWTYWGSRTSDGCQPAYGLLGKRHPVFYKAALLNTQLLERCTHEGLLQGGPHIQAAPSVHHTFCHAKALTTLLNHQEQQKKIKIETISLPREVAYGVRHFSDIRTWLISKGSFRGTVTGYEKEYKQTKNGHPSGGAIGLLWHEKAGIIFAASMNAYQLIESGNMLIDKDPFSIPLTPRMELKLPEGTYMNISDLNAAIHVNDQPKISSVTATASLVNGEQQSPASGKINCTVAYTFSESKVIIRFSHDYKGEAPNVRSVFPVIASRSEAWRFSDERTLLIKKKNGLLRISSNRKIQQLPSSGRVYNHVPGLEAIPVYCEEADVEIVIEMEG